MNGRPWTADDVALLRTLYGTVPPGEIAARLGRSRYAVHVRASKLGLNAGRRLELAGQAGFGLLTPLYPVMVDGRRCWVCECSCGRKSRPVPTSNLNSGNTSSCGCAKRHSRREGAAVPDWQKVCPQCGRVFTGYPRSVYCSPFCARRARYPVVLIACPMCGRLCSRRNGRRYCSRRCKIAAGIQAEGLRRLSAQAAQLERKLHDHPSH